ncbi:MAG: hypothetical protein AAF372_02635 [Pseudomonadota bacterium]
MLPARKNILYCKPPYLLKYATGKWSLVIDVVSAGEKIELTTLQYSDGEYKKSLVVINDLPFYVGADIWELAYGCVLMTLNHTTLQSHPANQLWLEWKEACNQNLVRLTGSE